MADPLEITKEITLAWLHAYQTDLSVRRQKGMVPLFTPTYEEVTEFITSVHKKVSELLPDENIESKRPAKKKAT